MVPKIAKRTWRKRPLNAGLSRTSRKARATDVGGFRYAPHPNALKTYSKVSFLRIKMDKVSVRVQIKVRIMVFRKRDEVSKSICEDSYKRIMVVVDGDGEERFDFPFYFRVTGRRQSRLLALETAYLSKL